MAIEHFQQDMVFYHIVWFLNHLQISGAIALSYPPFLSMILVQNSMLIKNHIETTTENQQKWSYSLLKFFKIWTHHHDKCNSDVNYVFMLYLSNAELVFIC